MLVSSLSAALYDNTYNETLGLLTKSESFLQNYSLESSRATGRNRILDLRVNCEMTRVTARLTQVMAWLLAQKAALAGEITVEEAASEKFSVKGDPFCLEDSLSGNEYDYPLEVRKLLEDSRALYKRILILSGQAKEGLTSSGQMPRTLN